MSTNKKNRIFLNENTKSSFKQFLLEIDGGLKSLEKIKANPDIPLYLTGIIQKGDSPNRNGRIYPFSILKKECERYMNEEIKDGQSFSELDHPCLDREHFIMTDKGWKSIVDVKIGDNVMTLNPNTKQLEYKPVYDKIDAPYKGKMFKMANNHFSAVATPNHKWYVYNGYKKLESEFLTTEELKKTKYYKIDGRTEWVGNDLTEIIIPGVDRPKSSSVKFQDTYVDEEIKFNAEYFMEFLGWFVTEGYTNHDDNKKDNTIQFSQTKEEGKFIIRNILKKLGISYYESLVKETNETTFTFANKRLSKYLRSFGQGAKNKCLPEEIKNLSPRLLEILINSMLLGDGHDSDFYTSSKQLANDFCEILIKAGYGATFAEKESYRNYYTVENVLTEEVERIDNIYYYTKSKYKDNKKNYQITNKERIYTGEKFYTVRKKERVTYSVDCIKFEEFEFDDRIYCVTVENHTFLTMRDGKITWTGNCESTVPELKNAAATVEDIWFKGTEVWGKVKLLNAYMPETAPGKIARGIVLNGKTLGISSRALGSVYQDETGYDIVEDDLELICWDLVSRPSTFDANLKLTEAKTKTKNLVLTECQCFGNNCNLTTSKQIIKTKKLQSLTEAEKVYLNILGTEKFLQLKNK